MNVEIETFLEVYGRRKLMVQTECHLAKCSRTYRLRSETNDGRLLFLIIIITTFVIGFSRNSSHISDFQSLAQSSLTLPPLCVHTSHGICANLRIESRAGWAGWGRLCLSVVTLMGCVQIINEKELEHRVLKTQKSRRRGGVPLPTEKEV